MSSETYIPNPAAFPTDSTHGYTPGMELRDYFAIHYRLLFWERVVLSLPWIPNSNQANLRYARADEMLAERAKKGGAS